MIETEKDWLNWAVELQALAQAGLQYGKDKFDKERYERIREISAEMVSGASGLPVETVKELFCCETGYQTPKLDSRAAIFRDGKILLVQEANGTWALPGGWVDAGLSTAENTVKEVKEEAGLDVKVTRVIAVQDREKHNRPVYAWKICKVFYLCEELGGEFAENSETISTGYFSMEELPKLAKEKITREQIEMCFAANEAEHWETIFD